MNKTPGHLLSLAALIALPALSQAEVSVTPAQTGAPWRWEDRRPVAQLFISQQANRTTANPDGYLNKDVNVTTDEGRAAFRTNLLAYADRCVKIIKDMDGQGVVVWDLEGYSQPSMVYVGDPRILPEYAPAMDKVADEFFQKFREAGLRTGLTIRPNRIFRIPPEGVAKWGKWGYLLYDDQKDDVVKELGERIAYAKKRWGCTLFYMDSNGYETWENGKKKSVTIPAAMLKQLHELHPDVLIIPEHPTPGGHEWTAQYRELRGGWKGTPEAERQQYPGAFSVLSLGGGVPDAIEQNWEALATSIAQGDVAFFEGWYPSGGNREVRDLYRQAEYQKHAKEVDPVASLERLLELSRDPNAAVRFNTVRALAASEAPPQTEGHVGPPLAGVPRDKTAIRERTPYETGHVGPPLVGVPLSRPSTSEGPTKSSPNKDSKRDVAAVPRLQAMLKEEPEWLVRKEVIVALGTIQGTAAIPMLTAEVERANYGEHLAALEQLRRHGDSALPAALKLAKGPKPQTRADAASLLGSIATKPAVEALATLMGDQDPLVRQRATACFKKIPGASKMIVPAPGDDSKEPDAALELDGPAASGTGPL